MTRPFETSTPFLSFLPVDPAFLATVLRMPDHERSKRGHTQGDCWRSLNFTGEPQPFLFLAQGVTREARPLTRFQWWTVIMREGGHFSEHKHVGNWSFVYYLTDGSPLVFPTLNREFVPEPGRMIVFPSTLAHETRPAKGPPRVSVAGNLWFE